MIASEIFHGSIVRLDVCPAWDLLLVGLWLDFCAWNARSGLTPTLIIPLHSEVAAADLL